MPLTYKLNPGAQADLAPYGKYSRSELEHMTTYQLRELCHLERLVISGLNPLDKEALIRLILRFRGREDALFIERYTEEGWARIAELLKRVELKTLQHTNARVPAKITVFQTLGLTRTDGCRIYLPGASQPGNALLLSEEGKLCAIFHLEPERARRDEYSLIQSGELPVQSANRKNYRLIIFDKRESDIVYSLYQNSGQSFPVQLRCHVLPVLDFEVREPVETSETLCIDFGSSNTAVGFFADLRLSDMVGAPYGTRIVRPDAINLLSVEDDGGRMAPLIPSAMGISGIEDGRVEYQYGYEAMHYLNHGYTDDTFSLFCDIKRWVSDPNRIEELTDKFGNRLFVPRKEILKRFFEHVILLAKRQFKCNFKYLHISCPVKQKYRFQELFEEILTGYSIEAKNRLDEGAAVLYNTISNLIDQNAYENLKPYKALIIDCGGGTTDLSSCTFRIDNKRVAYDIQIETAYEDGDTDFGGNNLTFRILQLLKILWAQSLANPGEASSSIFDDFDLDVYRAVDENGVSEIYGNLDERYRQAEKIIPTQFKLFESHDRADYFRVKANYYFLFDTAERIKTTFFSNLKSIGLHVTCSSNVLYKGMDNLKVDPWKLSRLEGDKLVTIRETPDLIINSQDIRMLLKADVYAIVRKFLDQMYHDDLLIDYSIIKLTGQSCKIDLFRESLKEFVPGRIIEFAKAGEQDRFELKLACLRGAIQYLYAKKQGYANVNISSRLSALPYSVLAYTHTGEETTLIHCKDASRTEGFISRHMERLTLKLYLLDSEGRRRWEYQYLCNPEDFKPVTHEQIVETYSERIIQDETDNIIEDEVKFFAFAKQELWGFYVVPVFRRDGQLQLGKQEFFQFENDVWEANFFDGMK